LLARKPLAGKTLRLTNAISKVSIISTTTLLSLKQRNTFYIQNMKINQRAVDGIVTRAKELGAGEGLIHKQGLFQLSGYCKPYTLEILANVLVNGWHGKYELIAAMQAGLEFIQTQSKQAVDEAYGRGVTAGKKEALGYTEDEKIAYIKHAAHGDGWAERDHQFDDEVTKRVKEYLEQLETHPVLDQINLVTDHNEYLQGEVARLQEANAIIQSQIDNHDAMLERNRLNHIAEKDRYRIALEQMAPISLAQMQIKEAALHPKSNL
jgi:hypothetical protein